MMPELPSVGSDHPVRFAEIVLMSVPAPSAMRNEREECDGCKHGGCHSEEMKAYHGSWWTTWVSLEHKRGTASL
jgi:hypothetical protein